MAAVTLEQLAARQLEGEAARRAMLTRRLESWLASEPRPGDIIETLFQVARRLDEATPGGLAGAGADLPLNALCRCLFFCDLDDFLAIWPAAREAAEGRGGGGPGE